MYIVVVGLFVTVVVVIRVYRARNRRYYKDKGTQTEMYYTPLEFEEIPFDPPKPWEGQQTDDDWPERLLRPTLLKESYCKVKQT